MEEKEFLSGGIDELNVMLQDFEKIDACRDKINQCTSENKRLKKALEQKKQEIEKEKNSAVKNELNGTIAEEEQVISINNKKIREVKSSRNKAKDRGIKDRIEVETEDLVKENKRLHREVRKKLRENDLPGFCDSKWFYTLYFTEGIVQWLIKIGVFLLCFVIIPDIVVKIVNPWFLFKFLLFALVDVIFFGVYITIFLVTKDKNDGTLEELQEEREKILDNERKIRKIKRGIKTDRDESQYNLSDFDEELEALKSNLDSVTKERDRKIKVFEEKRKPEIEEEVSAKYSEELDLLNKNIEENEGAYNKLLREMEAAKELVRDKYEMYFTEKFTTKSVCQKMMEEISEGRAGNIEEAFRIVKEKKFL